MTIFALIFILVGIISIDVVMNPNRKQTPVVIKEQPIALKHYYLDSDGNVTYYKEINTFY